MKDRECCYPGCDEPALRFSNFCFRCGQEAIRKASEKKIEIKKDKEQEELIFLRSENRRLRKAVNALKKNRWGF